MRIRVNARRNELLTFGQNLNGAIVAVDIIHAGLLFGHTFGATVEHEEFWCAADTTRREP